MEETPGIVECPHCGHRNDLARYSDAPGRYPGIGPVEFYCYECGKNLNPEHTRFEVGTRRPAPRADRRNVILWCTVAVAVAAVCGVAILLYWMR